MGSSFGATLPFFSHQIRNTTTWGRGTGQWVERLGIQASGGPKSKISQCPSSKIENEGDPPIELPSLSVYNGSPREQIYAVMVQNLIANHCIG